MRTSAAALSLAAALAGLAPAGAAAQGAPLTAPPLDQAYDPATVTTVSGVVVAEQRRRRGPGSVCVVLMGRDGTFDVHLGPDHFVDRQPLRLAPGDKVEVRGSRVWIDGAPAILAEVVTRGGETMVLRAADGTPRWSAPPPPR